MQSIFRAVLVMCLFALPGWAQSFGEIAGVVSDTTGAVIAGASVTVTNEATNASRNVTTNAAGIYTFPGLVPGVYTLRVEQKGFRPLIRSGIELQVQQVARVNATLEVGQLTESIVVSGLAVQLTTENAAVGTVIENRRIVDLPLNGRNFLQLVSLSPNVSYDFGGQGNASRQGGERMSTNMSIAGMRAVWNNYTLDGIANTDPNFNTYVVLPSVDMLQEFKVQTGIYAAEFGRAASQINVTTKGGSNEFHGALFEFVRNDKFDAKSFAFTSAQAVQPKNPFQWNQYGFTAGGPVWIPKVYHGRDRLFFNSNYEWFRERTRTNSYFTTPTVRMRQGDFSEVLSGDALWDPAGRAVAADGRTIIVTPFSGNRIPISRLAHQSKVLFEFWPEPNKASEDPTRPFRNYYKVNHNMQNRDQFHVRLDMVESSRSNWFGRYSWSDEVSITEGIRLNGSKLMTQAKQYMLGNTRTFTNTTVNEFRFGINSFFNTTGRELAFVRDVIAELKIPGLRTYDPAAWGTPRMTNITGFSGFGDDSQGPFLMNNATFHGANTLSHVRGRHSFRMGAEIRRDRYNQIGNEFGRGSFEFQGTATMNPNTKTGGYSVADYFLGYTSQAESAVATAFHQFRTTSQAYFFDDTWRVRPNLTVNFGLRYELTPPWWDRSHKYVNYHIPYIFFGISQVADMSLHPVAVRSGRGDFYDGVPLRYVGAQVARDGRLGDRLIGTDYNDFAPRLGIAWTITPRWTMRLGSGMFYSQETGNSRFDMARTLAGRVRAISRTDIPDVTMENFLGAQGTGPVLIQRPYTWAALYDIRTTRTFQWLINVQRELTPSTMLEAGYLGSINRHLQGLYDTNEPVPSPSGISAALRVPFPEWGVIQTVHGNGRGHYHGASVKLQRRMSAGLTALVSYTVSKSIDTVSAIRGQGDAQNANWSACLDCEKAVSGYNTPNRMVASLLWELPMGRGRHWGSGWHPALNGVLGGWQIGSIVTVQSGRPGYPYGSSGWSTLSFVLGERMNATGEKLRIPKEQRSTEQWFNPNAFRLQPYGTIGNAGRNVVLGPGQQFWDFSAHKAFRIREGHSLTFRFETFNFLNHPVWGTPTVSWGSTNVNRPGPSYNTIRSTATAMRRIQLGLKYVF